MKITNFVANFVALLLLLSFSAAECYAQPPVQTPTQKDPTLPSEKIRQRLSHPESVVRESNAPERAEIALPSITLKAIVMTDRDHGSALIEAAGRKLIVPLSRDAQLRLNGFTVNGMSMYIEDFTASSLLIRCGKQTLLVR